MKKRLLTALFLVLLATGICAAASAATTTVMLYMCGSNIQDDGVTDLGEICSANFGSDVQVMVLAGGANTWSDRRLTGGRLNFFTIANGSWSSVSDWGRANMGSTDTLRRFITEGFTNHRSDRMVLILWDHGSSAIYGMCFDEVFNDDAITLSEIESLFSSLQTSLPGFHLDIFGADACLMASYEMAVTLAPYADFFVASEELEPYLGWYYTNWLTDLGRNPGMSNRDLAISIVNSYSYGCNRDDPNDYLTLSAIDLSYMTQLNTHISALSSMLVNQMNAGQTTTISRTVQSMYVFGNYDDAGSDMVDLDEFFNLCALFDPNAVASARSVYQQAIVINYANSYVPSATGMSIFIPMENSSYLSSALSDYSTGAISGYTGFVTAFSGNVGGSSWTFTSSSSPSQVTGTGWYTSYWDTCTGSSCGYGTGFGFNTSGLVIAGSAGSGTGSTGGTSAGTGGTLTGLVIAGSQGGSQQTPVAVTAAPVTVTAAPATVTAAPAAATAAPATVTSGTVTAPPASAATMPPVLASSNVYSITLSDDDMHYLSYAELLFYADFSDQNGYDLDVMGRVRDVWIDWNSNTVYALVDGNWPSVGNVFVVMYEQSRNAAGRRCIIPILLNDTLKTYLVVEFPADSEVGTIIGTSEGWAANGLPVRGVTPLQIGDTFTPIYPTVYTNDISQPLDLNNMQSAWSVYDDNPDFIITWDGTQTVVDEALNDGDYVVAFKLHDVFGGETITTPAMITITN